MKKKRLSEAIEQPVVYIVRALTGEEFQDAQESAMSISKRGVVEDLDS